MSVIPAHVREVIPVTENCVDTSKQPFMARLVCTNGRALQVFYLLRKILMICDEQRNIGQQINVTIETVCWNCAIGM
jgi:hypothetical protein